MKASDLVCSIRQRVSDQAGKLWPTGQLLELINSALCEHTAVRPELYTKPVVVALTEGSIQQPDCCPNVVAVDVLTSKDGTAEYGKLRSTNELASGLFANRCGAKTIGGQRVPTSATIDPRMPGQFKVSPPVAKGQKLWARVYCVTPPPPITGEDSCVEVNCGNFEDLITFVISKLYTPGDGEVAALAATSRETFYKASVAKRQISYQTKRAPQP
jgi:hypothetical protein